MILIEFIAFIFNFTMFIACFFTSVDENGKIKWLNFILAFINLILATAMVELIILEVFT